jgi:chromosome segregation ATPase
VANSNSKKSGASKPKVSQEAAPVAVDCAKCDAKIEVLQNKVASLEASLKGVLEAISKAAKVKSELDEAKAKLGAEVNELKEKAKSWAEKADTNSDGKLDLEEMWVYISERVQGKSHARAKNKLKK